MIYQSLLTELNDGILTVTINRPDKLNALNKMVFDELEMVMNEVASNVAIRSVIITGSGPKAFAAGADIAEFSEFNREQGESLSKRGHQVFAMIENSSKPVVAAVNGFALGGGCELAMACHLRYCATHAKFGQPEVNLGLIPGYGGTQRMTHLIGKAKSLELHMTGQIIDANEAYRLGLVNQVTTAEELIPTVTSVLETIQSKAPVAIGHVIRCIQTAVMEQGADGYACEAELFGACFDTEDMREGTRAFLEKRKANFNGK
jgi:enoyl-CoA hydratase